ncbi:MAG: hypothetical protein ABIJ57_02560 [Pseudomonadota bacterium]
MITEQNKILVQSKPTADTLTDVYTVAASRWANVVRIIVCNQTAGDDAYRIGLAVAGAATEAKQYPRYDVPIAANDVHTIELNVLLRATDVLRVYSRDGDSSFTVIGTDSK